MKKQLGSGHPQEGVVADFLVCNYSGTSKGKDVTNQKTQAGLCCRFLFFYIYTYIYIYTCP